MKTMRIIALTVAVLVQVSFAHPAKDVELALSGDTLTVTAEHSVRNETTHYIDEITVSVGDSLIISRKYDKQTSKKVMVDTFVIPEDLLVDGATVYAETVCNKFGTKVGKLIVEKGEE